MVRAISWLGVDWSIAVYMISALEWDDVLLDVGLAI
jgi:hypothetical protein